ncbi:FBD-associated F-box protein At5g60610 [Lolium perenne]|uniref:FBD-associated F-box protein At5g60610 n=1 Tax=Lolium perenne TaxID=4522 RepID=UPI0021EACC94|nr:FBD-associated F-box protein At2g26860-like [Lolium perenne]
MEPQFIIGRNVSDLQARIERDGEDPRTLDVGINLMLYFVYHYIPPPPVSPAAAFSPYGALWIHQGVDRISRLPDNLLRNIVSRLPVKDAARTAALSRRWRPVWLSTPLTLVDSHLLPDCGEDGPYAIGGPSPRAVTAAVSRVLAAHPGPFRSVHLTCTTMNEHRGEMARWLDVLAAKGVKELIFVNRPWPLDLRLPTTLFSCTSLTRLYLGVWRLPDTTAVPRRAAFPNLLELGICLCVMEDRDLAFILERSPVLEILVITGSQTGVRLRLVSHSLRCLLLGFTYLEDIEVVNAPRLERLFQSTTFREPGGKGKFGRSMIKIGHAPNLRMLGYFEPGNNEIEITKTVTVAGIKEKIVPSVKSLAIVLQFGVRRALKKVPDYLRNFPNLETLHVQSYKAEDSTGKVNLKFLQEGEPIKCVLQTMKNVFFYEFQGSKSEVAFLKFIAERARVLEKMVVVVDSECFSSGANVNVKLKPLISAKWISQACKLQLFKSPRTEGGDPMFCHQLAFDFSFADPFDLVYYDESL